MENDKEIISTLRRKILLAKQKYAREVENIDENCKTVDVDDCESLKSNIGNLQSLLSLSNEVINTISGLYDELAMIEDLSQEDFAEMKNLRRTQCRIEKQIFYFERKIQESEREKGRSFGTHSKYSKFKSIVLQYPKRMEEFIHSLHDNISLEEKILLCEKFRSNYLRKVISIACELKIDRITRRSDPETKMEHQNDHMKTQKMGKDNFKSETHSKLETKIIIGNANEKENRAVAQVIGSSGHSSNEEEEDSVTFGQESPTTEEELTNKEIDITMQFSSINIYDETRRIACFRSNHREKEKYQSFYCKESRKERIWTRRDFNFNLLSSHIKPETKLMNKKWPKRLKEDVPFAKRRKFIDRHSIMFWTSWLRGIIWTL